MVVEHNDKKSKIVFTYKLFSEVLRCTTFTFFTCRGGTNINDRVFIYLFMYLHTRTHFSILRSLLKTLYTVSTPAVSVG